MQTTAAVLNNVSYYSFKFGKASKGIQIYPLIERVNAFFKELRDPDFINHEAKAISSLQYHFIHSETNWFSSPISSLVPHLLDNNYLADFMAE